MSFFRLSRPTFLAKFQEGLGVGGREREREERKRREDTGGGEAKTNYWNAANISSGIPSAFGGPERWSLEKYVNTLLREEENSRSSSMFGQRARTIGRFKSMLNERI